MDLNRLYYLIMIGATVIGLISVFAIIIEWIFGD